MCHFIIRVLASDSSSLAALCRDSDLCIVGWDWLPAEATKSRDPLWWTLSLKSVPFMVKSNNSPLQWTKKLGGSILVEGKETIFVLPFGWTLNTYLSVFPWFSMGWEETWVAEPSLPFKEGRVAWVPLTGTCASISSVVMWDWGGSQRGAKSHLLITVILVPQGNSSIKHTKPCPRHYPSDIPSESMSYL